MKQNCLTERVLLSALFAAALTSGQAAEPVTQSSRQADEPTSQSSGRATEPTRQPLDQATEPTSQALMALPPTQPELKYRVGVSYRLGYEIPVTFKQVGAVPLQNNPGNGNPITGLTHYYDDGYVVPDTRQVADDYTWNWGFDDASQVQPGQGTPYGSLLLHSSSSPGTSHGENNFQNGFEITFSRQLGKIRRYRWGVEGAFNFENISVRDRDTLYGPVTTVTDTYALDGLNPFMPPPAPPNTPYQGSPGGGYPGGGGPLITDYPASRDIQTVDSATTITGTRKFDATAFGLRVGPYLEIPLSESISFLLSGGFAMVYVDSDYKFHQTASIVGGTPSYPGGSDSHGDWMPGGYVAGKVSVDLSKHWAVAAGAQFMDCGVYKDTVNGQEVTMDLRQAIFLTLGITYSF